jgi:hypothetical protein
MNETLSQDGRSMPQTFLGSSKFVSHLWHIPTADILEFTPFEQIPAQHRKNSLSTEERAKFDQFHSKMYRSLRTHIVYSVTSIASAETFVMGPVS